MRVFLIRQRIELMCATGDGSELAEADRQLRSLRLDATFKDYSNIS